MNDLNEDARAQARRRLEARRARQGAASSSGTRQERAAFDGARLASGVADKVRQAGDAVGKIRQEGDAVRRTRQQSVVVGGTQRRRGGRKNKLPFIAAAVILILIIGFLGLRSCLKADDPESKPVEETAPVETLELDVSALDRGLLADILDSEDLADELIEKAKHNEDLYWIASHPEAYAVDGDSAQRKLLKLATEEPEAIPFVRNWPESYPSEVGEPCTDADKTGGVPHLYQWDPRWGYTVYSSTTFALTACGPTALSMVYQGLTGNNDLSPYDLGLRAKADGYMTEFNGTDTYFFIDEADDLGLVCYEISISSDSLRSTLRDGAIVIANVGAGDFTEAGHFIVLAGLDEEGKLIVNDPFSAERSSVTWDVDRVISQTRLLYAYELA